MLTLKTGALDRLDFWIREKRQSQAEVDFVVTSQGIVVPVEVKSNAAGQLRSLHQFIDASPYNLAVRIYSGTYRVEEHATVTGKKYRLINLPFYLVHRLQQYLTLSLK
jgi:hypothetical protein